MTNKVSFTSAVSLTRTIEQLPITDSLFAVRVTDGGTFEGNCAQEVKEHFSSFVKPHVREMVLNPQQYEHLVQGRSYEPLNFYCASPEFFEDARTLGYVKATTKHAKDLEQKNYFSRLQNKQQLQLVRLDHSSHLLFDAQGHILPVGILFNYMSGHMQDGAYDLQKVQHLVAAKPQTFKSVDGKKIEVKNVPYFNVSRGCSHSLTFMFCPTQEQMEQIWVKAQELESRYPSTALHQAIWELDSMGLRAAGAAKGQHYWDVENDEDWVEQQED